MNRRLVPDTEPLEHTAISCGFNVEVADSLYRYVRLLHLHITIWTTTFTGWAYIGLCSR